MRTAISIMLTAFALTAFATDAQQSYEPRQFVVEVISSAPGSEQRFRGAIGHDGQLQLIESMNPFRKEFSAVGLTGMFEAADTNGKIVATLYENRDGNRSSSGMSVAGQEGLLKNPGMTASQEASGDFE